MAWRPPEIVRVFEFGRVDLPPRLNTARVRERVELAALRAGIRAFENRGKHLYALGVVGVIDLGDLVVEILPKTHQTSTAADGAIFLTDMLRFTGVLEGLTITDARIGTGERTMLEIILAWAASEASRNVRDGLPKRYEAREEISTAIRGRVQLGHLARQRPGKDFELLIRHAPMSENNPLSRIISWLLAKIALSTRVTGTQIICRRLQQDFAPVEVEITSADLEKVVLQPAELRWRPLVDLAGMLLRQESPNPGRAGETQAIAILFTLHDLFERVLRRVFTEEFRSVGLGLRRLNRHLLQPEGDNGMLLRLKPDFVFGPMGDANRIAVGDAKWKRILSPSGEMTLSESDAYQITAYLTSLNGDVGFIFSPLSALPAPADFRVVSCDLIGTVKRIHVIGIFLPAIVALGAPGDAFREALCRLVVTLLTPAWPDFVEA